MTEATAEGSCRRASGVCGANSYSYSVLSVCLVCPSRLDARLARTLPRPCERKVALRRIAPAGTNDHSAPLILLWETLPQSKTVASSPYAFNLSRHACLLFAVCAWAAGKCPRTLHEGSGRSKGIAVCIAERDGRSINVEDHFAVSQH